MDVSVRMTSDEFLEFLAWQQDKNQYADKITRLRRAPELIASSLRYALEPTDGKKAKFKIVDHEHLSDAWDYAQEFMGQ